MSHNTIIFVSSNVDIREFRFCDRSENLVDHQKQTKSDIQIFEWYQYRLKQPNERKLNDL